MAKASKSGLTGPLMRATGGTEFCKARAYLNILMATSILVRSFKTELTGSELTFMKMVKFMKATGKMICTTERAKKSSQMVQLTMECLMKGKEKDMVFINLVRTILFIKAIGKIT